LLRTIPERWKVQPAIHRSSTRARVGTRWWRRRRQVTCSHDGRDGARGTYRRTFHIAHGHRCCWRPKNAESYSGVIVISLANGQDTTGHHLPVTAIHRSAGNHVDEQPNSANRDTWACGTYTTAAWPSACGHRRVCLDPCRRFPHLGSNIRVLLVAQASQTRSCYPPH
jgi:hypothetical protein